MIIDADITVWCDICKDERAWVAVVIQSADGKLRQADIDIAVEETGWKVVPPVRWQTSARKYRCPRCQLETNP